MKPEQLKASILQFAVQGKLVEQKDNEGTATDLLDKYKEILTVKEATDFEPPFDIPASWRWVALGDVFLIERGGSPRPIKEYITTADNGINWIKIGDTEKGSKYINSCSEKIKPEGMKKSRFVHKGDFILSNSMSFGRPYILNIEGCIHDGWLVLHQPEAEVFYKDYLYYLLSSPLVFNQFAQKAAGGLVSNLNIDRVSASYVALPPFEEQKRIVAKIEEMLPYVDRYAESYQKLEQFNAKFPEDMKKSILQYAIQGKLVEQRPDEGTAEELYQQIQDEKQKIEKKSKKGVANDDFPEDEILFDIPETWKWVHLKDIMSVYGGKRIPAGKKLTKENTGHIYIRVSDMKDGSVMDTDIHYVPEDIYPLIKNYTISKDDVYITVAGTIGRVGIIPDQFDNANLTENADKLIIYSLNKEYVMYLMSSPIIQRQITDATTKVGQPKLAIKRIEDMTIPLPPLREQERIVAKIEELLPYCDQLIK